MAMILAPLRGVTIRSFRETFAAEIAAAGFTEAVTPFIPAMAGVDPLRDRELKGGAATAGIQVTPQFIGKDPRALRECLLRIREGGYRTADLNCGCPFPMVRNKGRGSGILRTPETLRQLVDTGCEVMGPGGFSIKARLGVERPDELLALMPMLNEYPLRRLTVHARTARQMYSGVCDRSAFARIAAVARMPIVYNGDVTMAEAAEAPSTPVMIGRGWVRALGEREDSRELLLRYLEASVRELSGDRAVLGRLKELLAYWAGNPQPVSRRWAQCWDLIKLCRSVEELIEVVGVNDAPKLVRDFTNDLTAGVSNSE